MVTTPLDDAAGTRRLAPPDDAPCWDGVWTPVDPAGELWLLAALMRTVDTLPRLHPLRLGDERGSRRIVRWSGSGTALHPRQAYAVLTEQAREPRLATGDGPADAPSPYGIAAAVDVAGALTRSAVGAVVSASGALLDATEGAAPRWAGVAARMPGAWLPPLAILPAATRAVEDPGPAWTTESLAFNDRHRVHTADTRFAADLLAPHVMAIVLDRIPDVAAVTVAGDAAHVWWEHRPPLRNVPGLVQRMLDAVRALVEAVPSFVLADHPDRSGKVEAELDAKADAADAYRRERRPGRSRDPVMQRIYDQAKAAYEARDVSSRG